MALPHLSQYTEMDKDSGIRMAHATPEQWRALGMLVICVLINYLDRGNLSVAASDLTKELGLTPSQMGIVLSSFFWTYALSQIVAGWLLDRYDVYWVLGTGFFIMSAGTALTSLASGFTWLLVCRLLVGAGASVAFPCFSKILAHDFPETQRGKANAAIDVGTKTAPAIGMIGGGLMVAHYGWRPLFLLLGLGAMIWIPIFFRWRPKASMAETRVAVVPAPGMLELLRHRSVWGSFFGLYCLNSAWYFLITWFPYYLIRQRHFSTERMAVLGSVPFWLLAISVSLSGWLSDRWIGRGGNPTFVRKTFLVTGMLMCTLLFPAGLARNDNLSIALFTLACFAFGMTTSNHWGVTQTIAGTAAAGKWTGMQNCFGNLAGISTPWIAGLIVERTKSFDMVFVFVAVMVTLGAASYAFLVGRLEPIRWSEPRGLQSGQETISSHPAP